MFDRLAQPFGSAAGKLGLATAFAGCRCRACRDPALPGLSRPANQIDQPFKSVLAIAFLRPKAPRHDDENAVGGHPPSSQQAQSGSRRVVQARRAEGIEAELDCGGDLVDVLSARAAGANEDLFDLVLVDRNAAGDRDHLPWFVLTLDADIGRDRGDFVPAAREKRRLDDGHAVLIGAGRMALDDKAPNQSSIRCSFTTSSQRRSVCARRAPAPTRSDILSAARTRRPKRLTRSRLSEPSAN